MIQFYTIKGDDGTPYMTRLVLGHLRLHIFHRGDQDPDCHDHPWDFWTFPLTSYVEEVSIRQIDGTWKKEQHVVEAFKLHFRPATHTHRVLGPWWDNWWDPGLPIVEEGRIWTIVWTKKVSRKWGFLKLRDGRWCWEYWRNYNSKQPCDGEEP